MLDATDHKVLYARRADVPVPIASITKLMTTLVVAEARQPLDARLQVSGDDRAIGRGAYSRLAVGTRLTRAQLFHLALMASENRAAHALARNYPGGLAACIRAMNAKARALGMTHTHFVEPTGLSSHNVSTPDDLAKLVMAAAGSPVIRRYSTSRGYTIRSGRRMVAYHNTDQLVDAPLLAHRRAEDGLHRRCGPLPGDAGDHRPSHRRHGAARFLGQVHARGRRAASQGMDGGPARPPPAATAG